MSRAACHRLAVLVVMALVILPPALVWHTEAQAARTLRESYRFGSHIGYGLFVDDLVSWWEKMFASEPARVAPSSNGVISDHDLFMLVEAARFQVGRDDGLARAQAAGRLPVRYAYLDGFDTNTIVLRRSLRDALPQMAPPDDTAQPSPLGTLTSTSLASWQLAPVIVSCTSSPSVRDAAAHAIADEPLLSTHTCGQVLTSDVRTWGVRYALTCVRDDPLTRATHLVTLGARVSEIASKAKKAATADDDAAYVRAAFDILSRTTGYAERDSSTHDNDAYGALVEGAARCYGLSGALKLVLDVRGIPNYLANGTKAGERHTVNVVWMDGSWRVCDLTLMVDARTGNAGLSADAAHRGIYACLELERNYCVAHGFTPDDDARILELVYSRLVSDPAA